MKGWGDLGARQRIDERHEVSVSQARQAVKVEHAEQAVDLKAVIAVLNKHLGSRLLALTVGVDHKTVGRWLTEEGRAPRFETETRLRAAYQASDSSSRLRPPRPSGPSSWA